MDGRTDRQTDSVRKKKKRDRDRNRDGKMARQRECPILSGLVGGHYNCPSLSVSAPHILPNVPTDHPPTGTVVSGGSS